MHPCFEKLQFFFFYSSFEFSTFLFLAPSLVFENSSQNSLNLLKSLLDLKTFSFERNSEKGENLKVSLKLDDIIDGVQSISNKIGS